MNFWKLLVVTSVPALMAASCNSHPDLPKPDSGFGWKTVNSASGLNEQPRHGFVGQPTWAEDGSLVSGAEQYYQQKNTCNGFPVCTGYETKDYRYRVFTQSLGSQDKLYLNVITPGIITNLFHLENQGYWLTTHQTEGPDPELVFSRLTRSSDQPIELGREKLDFVDLHDSWWLPSPDGETIGRAVCNRMPDFSGNTPTYPDTYDNLTQTHIPYGHCALSFIDPDNGSVLGQPVLTEFTWSDSGWDINNEPYDFDKLPRYGFVYWTADGAFAVSDYKAEAFGVYPGENTAMALELRNCQGPLTLSASINTQGDVLSVVDGEISIIRQMPEATFEQCN